MFTFLIVVHAIIAAALVGVILMQRSEGGGLGMGGSPSGLMSARGHADFLTRATATLASLFVGFSILLAFIAAARHSTAIDTSLARRAPATEAVPGGPPVAPAAGAADAAGAAAAGAAAAGAGNQTLPASNGAVPLER